MVQRKLNKITCACKRLHLFLLLTFFLWLFQFFFWLKEER